MKNKEEILKMGNILLSRWFIYSIQVILIILIGVDAFYFKTVYLGLGAIVFEIVILTLSDIRDSKRDEENKKVEEWRDEQIKRVGEDIKEISLEKK